MLGGGMGAAPQSQSPMGGFGQQQSSMPATLGGMPGVASPATNQPQGGFGGQMTPPAQQNFSPYVTLASYPPAVSPTQNQQMPQQYMPQQYMPQQYMPQQMPPQYMPQQYMPQQGGFGGYGGFDQQYMPQQGGFGGFGGYGRQQRGFGGFGGYGRQRGGFGGFGGYGRQRGGFDQQYMPQQGGFGGFGQPQGGMNPPTLPYYNSDNLSGHQRTGPTASPMDALRMMSQNVQQQGGFGQPQGGFGGFDQPQVQQRIQTTPEWEQRQQKMLEEQRQLKMTPEQYQQEQKLLQMPREQLIAEMNRQLQSSGQQQGGAPKPPSPFNPRPPFDPDILMDEGHLPPGAQEFLRTIQQGGAPQQPPQTLGMPASQPQQPPMTQIADETRWRQPPMTLGMPASQPPQMTPELQAYAASVRQGFLDDSRGVMSMGSRAQPPMGQRAQPRTQVRQEDPRMQAMRYIQQLPNRFRR